MLGALFLSWTSIINPMFRPWHMGNCSSTAVNPCETSVGRRRHGSKNSCRQAGVGCRVPMLQISISFPSGCGDTFLCPELSKVGDLKLLAQRSFRQGFLKLVTAKGCLLTNLTDSLQAAGIQDGEHLIAVAQQGQVSTTKKAFAA